MPLSSILLLDMLIIGGLRSLNHKLSKWLPVESLWLIWEKHSLCMGYLWWFSPAKILTFIVKFYFLLGLFGDRSFLFFALLEYRCIGPLYNFFCWILISSYLSLGISFNYFLLLVYLFQVVNCHESVIYILAPLRYATVYGCSDATVVLGAVGKVVLEDLWKSYWSLLHIIYLFILNESWSYYPNAEVSLLILLVISVVHQTTRNCLDSTALYSIRSFSM